MAKAALAKLVILFVLIFIICIPEFFWSHRGLRVDFLCVPCRPTEECGWLKKRHVEESGREKRRAGECDPCLVLGSDQPQAEPVCTAADRGNGTDPGSDYEGSDGDPGPVWFMCETDVEEAYSRGSGFMSDSLKGLEVWMVVQLEETVHLNVVLYDQRNTTTVYIHPPAEPDEEADDRQKAFYCCLPPPPVPQPANRIRCLIQLANRRALSEAVKQALPSELTGKTDEWGSVFRALWMALVGVLLLLVLTSLLAKVYRKRGKSKGGPLCGTYKESRLNGSCPLVDTSSGIVLSTLGLPHRTVLTPIQEDESPTWEVVPGTLLAGNVDGHDPSGSFTAHLHHRGHPSLSSISEEQAL